MTTNAHKYTEEHEWVSVNGDMATVGISKYAVDELGEIVYVEFPEKGNDIAKKDEFGSIESVKTVSSLYSPISGKIQDINSELDENPALLNDSPEENGWLIKINISNPEELNELMSKEEYKHYLETL